MTIRWNQVKDYGATLADRGKFRSVVPYRQDQEERKRATERAGEGEPTYIHSHTYPLPVRPEQRPDPASIS